MEVIYLSENYLKELFIDEVKGALNQGGGSLINMDDESALNLLVDTDMLPAIHDPHGRILTNGNGKILLRY